MSDQDTNRPDPILTAATDMASAIANSNGVPTIVGNPDDWKLINKFINGDKTLMRSTKAYEVKDLGVLVQISTDVKGNVAEALQFIPQAKLKQNEGDPKSWSIVADTPDFSPYIDETAAVGMTVTACSLNDDGVSFNLEAQVLEQESEMNSEFFRFSDGAGTLCLRLVDSEVIEQLDLKEGDRICVFVEKPARKPL